MNKCTLLFTLLLFSQLAFSATGILDPARISIQADVKVVDEQGEPVTGAFVEMLFHLTGIQQRKTGDRYKAFEKTFTGPAPLVFKYDSLNLTFITVTKEGYYSSHIRYNWGGKDQVKEGSDRHYKEFTIVLRKKVNQRPLYVHLIEIKPLPSNGLPYGYDMERKDWVAPHGDGKVVDFLVHVERADFGGELHTSSFTLSFPNKDDGIIPVFKNKQSASNLLLGHVAPEEGYQSQYMMTKEVFDENGFLSFRQHPEKSELEKVEGFWLRTRSEVDSETGELTARYGKILGHIHYVATKEGSGFRLTYYLSPDDSPSLEWNGESLVPNAYLKSVKKR